MTAVDMTSNITVAEVDASINRVIQHAESIWDEWAWQVENRTWEIKGYGSWDEMRRAEYGSLTSVTAPRAERPELVARFRSAGLTQRETADTLGVSRETVQRNDSPTYTPREPKAANDAFEPDVIDAEIVEDDDYLTDAATGEEVTTRDEAPSTADDSEGEPSPGLSAPPSAPPVTRSPRPVSDEQRRERERREALTDLYSHQIGKCLLGLAGYGERQNPAEVMAQFSHDYLDPPEIGRFYKTESLYAVRRFVDALIEWQEQ